MSTPSLCVNGFYRELPATVRLCPHLSHSSVSIAFALTHNIPRTVAVCPSSSVATTTCRGPVVVPTANGFLKSAFALTVEYLSGCDVVLGLDWFRATGVIIEQGGVCDPSSPLSLSSDHSWSERSHGMPLRDPRRAVSYFSVQACVVFRRLSLLFRPLTQCYRDSVRLYLSMSLLLFSYMLFQNTLLLFLWVLHRHLLFRLFVLYFLSQARLHIQVCLLPLCVAQLLMPVFCAASSSSPMLASVPLRARSRCLSWHPCPFRARSRCPCRPLCPPRARSRVSVSLPSLSLSVPPICLVLVPPVVYLL
ncbi:hypothetical protein BC629DRAFT_421396 [Irpex lacteus]|nr:hypothetical protein BC629DRAFT_421396 [Irpex lacteus]